MSLSHTVLLGLIAGGTIFLGLPVGRLRRMPPGLRVFLSAVAVGVLVFLVWDVLSAAWEPLDAALGDVHDHAGGGGRVAGYGLIFAVGLSVGLLGLVGYEHWLKRRSASLTRNFGPGAMSAGELTARRAGIATWSPARRMALLIAIGIGLHNFAEGLAIGQSAAKGDIALATLLVVGFGLHNATEGFGIVAPLAGGDDRPSWAFLAAMGVVGGGPTFVGAALGHGFTSEPVSVAFLTLAAGSILYVVIQLLGVAAKAKRPELVASGLLLGLLAGFATDAVVTLAGV
ncbi:MAG: zinc transporter, family [Frankiaceae bacterium]|nr:zinc transporter, family [Frankiaceae bacterium]MDQ1635459.1 zinc transporter, family [Frankiaceae bacterium]